VILRQRQYFISIAAQFANPSVSTPAANDMRREIIFCLWLSALYAVMRLGGVSNGFSVKSLSGAIRLPPFLSAGVTPLAPCADGRHLKGCFGLRNAALDTFSFLISDG
jgi:hypothetical protein